MVGRERAQPQSLKQHSEGQIVGPKTVSNEGVPPATSVEFAEFMKRAAKIVRLVLPQAGVKDFEAGPMVRGWLLRQTGKPRENKISAVKFEELLSRLESEANP